MKKCYVVVFSLAVLLGAAVAQTAPTGTLPARLFYVFPADDAALRLGAANLDRWNEDHGRPLQLLGLVQHLGEAGAVGQEGLSFPLIGTAATDEAGLPAELAGQLDNPAGFVLLLDHQGQARASGPAAELNQILAQAERLLGLQVATEVDESTWGKVKEIFK